MKNVYYVGFNGYQQCPNNGSTILPKVIYEWKQFSLKSADDVECTFRNVIFKTNENFIIYGLTNEDKNRKTIKFPANPQAFLATDDYLFVSNENKLWRSKYDNNWSCVIFLCKSEEESLIWNNLQITKLCYIHNKPQMIILSNDGSVWKLNADNKLSYIYFPSIEKAIDISCGFEHGLILTESGCVLTFGNGSHGQLGHGDLEPLSEPGQVSALGGLKVVKIAAAGWHSSAITDSGDLYMWGWNNFGQLTEIKEDSSGENLEKYEVVPFPTVVDFEGKNETNVADIACGVRHTVIITERNEVLSTGWNEYGQLGINDAGLKNVSKFTHVQLPAGITEKRLRCGPWSTLVYEEN